MPEIADYSLLDMAEAAQNAEARFAAKNPSVKTIRGRNPIVEAMTVAGLAYENAALLAERMGHDDVAEAIRELAEML